MGPSGKKIIIENAEINTLLQINFKRKPPQQNAV